MGGMIAQVLAAQHGPRLRSVASIMSSSGAPGLPGPTPEAAAALMSTPKDPESRDSVIETALAVQRVIGSPGYPTAEATLRERAGRAYDRCYCPDGVGRQMLAVLACGSRVPLLRSITVPALVLHGADDPLVPLAAGEDTARHIPGAELRVVPGMGHDVAEGLVPLLLEALLSHAAKAESP
jgi:proline iminopeptidase